MELVGLSLMQLIGSEYSRYGYGFVWRHIKDQQQAMPLGISYLYIYI